MNSSTHERHAAATIQGWVERSAKYTNSWPRRFCSFTAGENIFAYGENESAVKSTMQVRRIVRAAEIIPDLKKGSGDLLCVALDGHIVKEKKEAENAVKDETWTIRMPDEATLAAWYEAVRNSLARTGLMEPINAGLPAVDPRMNIEFARIPLECLHTFGLLEKAIVYFFGGMNMVEQTGGGSAGGGGGTQLSTTINFLAIGDTRVYVFRPSADTVRCFNITLIDQVYVGQEAGFLAIKALAPQHDLLFRQISQDDLQHIVQILTVLFKVLSPNQQRDLIVEMVDGSPGEIVQKLHLSEREGYKLQMVSPMPKSRLRQALDAFKAEHGVGYRPDVVVEKKPERSEPKEPSRDPDLDLNDPMTLLLMKLNLQQYIHLLRKQHIDLDMLTCMEEDDLVPFGVKKLEHRRMICDGARGDIRASQSPPPQRTQQKQQQQQQQQQSLAEHDLADSLDDINVTTTQQQQRRMSIHLDDDDDDLPPIRRGGAADSIEVDELDISPPAKQNKGPLVLEENSDDDLIPHVSNHAVNLDDDDDI